MKKILLLIILLLTPYIFISIEGLFDDNIPENTNRELVGVIYGNKIELDGAPSKRLEARLNKSYELYINGTINSIMVSGGVGIEGFDEAVVMSQYLKDKGVLGKDIITDSQGYTTKKTSMNAKELLGDDVIVVGVTQWFHIARVKLSLKQSGFDEVYGYAPKYFEIRDFYSILRELPAYGKYYIDNFKK